MNESVLTGFLGSVTDIQSTVALLGFQAALSSGALTPSFLTFAWGALAIVLGYIIGLRHAANLVDSILPNRLWQKYRRQRFEAICVFAGLLLLGREGTDTLFLWVFAGVALGNFIRPSFDSILVTSFLLVLVPIGLGGYNHSYNMLFGLHLDAGMLAITLVLLLLRRHLLNLPCTTGRDRLRKLAQGFPKAILQVTSLILTIIAADQLRPVPITSVRSLAWSGNPAMIHEIHSSRKPSMTSLLTDPQESIRFLAPKISPDLFTCGHSRIFWTAEISWDQEVKATWWQCQGDDVKRLDKQTLGKIGTHRNLKEEEYSLYQSGPGMFDPKTGYMHWSGWEFKPNSVAVYSERRIRALPKRHEGMQEGDLLQISAKDTMNSTFYLQMPNGMTHPHGCAGKRWTCVVIGAYGDEILSREHDGGLGETQLDSYRLVNPATGNYRMLPPAPEGYDLTQVTIENNRLIANAVRSKAVPQGLGEHALLAVLEGERWIPVTLTVDPYNDNGLKVKLNYPSCEYEMGLSRSGFSTPRLRWPTDQVKIISMGNTLYRYRVNQCSDWYVKAEDGILFDWYYHSDLIEHYAQKGSISHVHPTLLKTTYVRPQLLSRRKP